ncbi:CPBP family intramembrane glutamic endopeptidase [Sphingomonas sp. PB2P19]|uniref:CPBP family intramembrane glutamic endopeptidase n=1 Tax=Sphingomonas rhamnosi TaxID=3096156 RepID=UPI002FCADFDA
MTELALGDAGVLSPGRWRWARTLGWAALMLAVLIAALATQAIARKLVGEHHAGIPVIALVSLLLAYGAYYAMVRFGERRRVSELSLRALPRDLGIGLLIGVGMFTLVFASLRLLGVYTLAPGLWTDWGHDVRETLATGLVEELLIRLVLFRLLMRAFGVWPALIGSALFFGAAHLANANATYVAAIAIAVEAGLMLAAFYLLTGRIWMSVGVHAAWNFTQGAIFGARVSGQTGTGSLFVSGPVPGSSEMLSGGAFGPEASLPAVIVGLAIFLIVLRAALDRQPALRSADAVGGTEIQP